MVKTSKVVDESLSDKIDLDRLQRHLEALGLRNVFVCIVCSSSTIWDSADDAWLEDGYTNISIQIRPEEIEASDAPFEVVKQKVDERLRDLKIAA
jgi:hypothetical protein